MQLKLFEKLRHLIRDKKNMKLLTLLPAVFSQLLQYAPQYNGQQYGDDHERKLLKSFDCFGETIEVAIASAANVEVHGCVDHGKKGAKKGSMARCMFKCGKNTKFGDADRVLMEINAERKKKGKKPKKPKKDQKNKKHKKGKKNKQDLLPITASCGDSGWAFLHKKIPKVLADLFCVEIEE